MQSSRLVWRQTCHSPSAFNPTKALAAFFCVSSRRSSALPPNSRIPEHFNFTRPSDITRNRINERKNKVKELQAQQKTDKDAVVQLIGIPLYGAIRKHTTKMWTLPPTSLWSEHLGLLNKVIQALSINTSLDDLPVALRDFIDYRGINIQPSGVRDLDSEVSLESYPPWQIPLSRMQRMHSPMEVLNAEITGFAKWMELTPAEQECRRLVIQEILALVEAADIGEYQTEPFGSGRIGLGSPQSDIDLRLFNSTEAKDDQNTTKSSTTKSRDALTRVMTLVNESPRWASCLARPGRIPIINTRHEQTGIAVQIVAAPSTHRQQAVSHKYLKEVPHVREIYYILHTALNMRGLGDVWKGGPGSYGLFIWIATILRLMKSRSATTEKIYAFSNDGNESTAHHFLECLRFIARFPFDDFALSPELTMPIPKHDLMPEMVEPKIQACLENDDPIRAGMWSISRQRLQPYMLCLQDPANPNSDLGLKSNAIKHIRYIADILTRLIERDLGRVEKIMSSPPDDPMPRKLPSFLGELVGDCHELWYHQRAQAEQYGQATAQGNDLLAFRSP